MQRLTTERVMQVALFLLIFAMATRIPTDTDTWWHIRSGAHTLQHGFIYEDPFSFTRSDAVWINHSWGAQLLIYGAYTLLGNVGLALYTALLATAGMFFVYITCAGSTYLRAFAVVLGGAAAAVFWSPRPQMISFFLSTVVLYLLFLYKFRQIDRLWLIPPLMLLWGNLHAGFSIGFIFLVGMIAGEVAANVFGNAGAAPWRGVRKLVIIGLLSAALIMINPYGYRMLLLPFQTVGIDVLRTYIQEWQSPNFQQAQVLPFLALLLLTLGAVGASSRRLTWTSFVLLSGTAYMAFAYGRNIAVFAVVATPILTFHVHALLHERGWDIRPRRRVPRSMGIINAVFLGLIAAGALGKIVFTLQPERVAEAQAEFLPVRVSGHLADADSLPGNMFNNYDWGGYLLWAVPDVPVFVDGRTDLYGNDFLTEYIATYTASNDWREVFERYGIGTVVVAAGTPLHGVLANVDDWMLSYEDEQAVVYVQR